MRSKRAGYIVLIIALLAGILFLQHYIGIIALTLLTALLFDPIHNWCQQKGGWRARFATTITLVAVCLSVLIPLLTMAGLSYYEATQFAEDIKEHSIASNTELTTLSGDVSNVASGLGITVSANSIRDKTQDVLAKVIPGIISFIVQTTGSIASFIVDAIVYFMVLATVLSRKRDLLAFFKSISPFDESIDTQYLDHIKSMAISMVKGTFLIALTIGLISSATLWLIGFPYIAFWFMLFTFLSIIPLGAGIIFGPIGGILILTGNVWQGLLVLFVYFVIVNNVDSVLRPRLVPDDTKLPGVLVLISTFAGVSFFGVIGVVYGPIVMVLIYTSIELYDQHKKTGLPMKKHITSKATA